jgi:hypothetical protein
VNKNYKKELAFIISISVVLGCNASGKTIEIPAVDGSSATWDRPFECRSEKTAACIENVLHTCESVRESLREKTFDCKKKGLVCVPEKKACAVCAPNSLQCDDNAVVRCLADGEGFEVVKACDKAAGDMCTGSTCRNMCDVAKSDRSYVGCEFYAADLDNAALDEMDDASHQQFAVVVSNLNDVPAEVTVEINQAKVGDPVQIHEVQRAIVPPNDLEIFDLPRREVDGSSQYGINDGTNTAFTSNAYFIKSSHPIIAYQFNPIDNVNVFSNEASLLIPTSALGDTYTVVGWPQTIGNSSDSQYDFDHTSSNEDLRAFLTIIGTEESTHLTVEMGSAVVDVVGADPVPELKPYDTLDLDIGPFDVVNLETQGFMADFTGSIITASNPVVVFVGSEASDAPVFTTYSTRQCCADHLEEQLIPDATLGRNYIISRMPSRTAAVNAAFADPKDSVANVEEPEYIRIVAVEKGETGVLTTLPAPDDSFTIKQRDVVDIETRQDFMIIADKPISVLQTLPSQQVVGIDKTLPGGDPSIIVVPPVEQYRDNYVFLTPNNYAFDFVTITADPKAQVRLDDAPVTDQCTMSSIDGSLLDRKKPLPSAVVYRCQLAFPEISSLPNPIVSQGVQKDGVHQIVADEPVGIIVFGFDRFVSYAYVGGLNLQIIY